MSLWKKNSDCMSREDIFSKQLPREDFKKAPILDKTNTFH